MGRTRTSRSYFNRPIDEIESNLILENMGLVHTVAWKYWEKNKSLCFDDLKQAGLLGVVEAARSYDANRCSKFGYFAFWIIQKHVRNYIRDNTKSFRYPTFEHFQEVGHQEFLMGNLENFDRLNYPGLAEDTISKNIDFQSGKKLLLNAINELPERYKVILLNYYGINCNKLTLLQVGEKLNLTRERVRKLKITALKLLKNKLSTLDVRCIDDII